jgi:hypothetical protein
LSKQENNSDTMFFQKRVLNSVNLAQCNPIIVNQTNYSLILFLDRGVLYNKQVLAPGEAVGMTRNQTAGLVMPYRIHAVVGDEKSLPTQMQSLKNALSTVVIPTAFIVGTLAAASSAGTLTGPASALSRAAGGLVIRGLVIDSAALAAGSLTASRAAFIADKLLEKYPENFSAKSGLFLPGNRFVVIKGGIEEPLTITCIDQKGFRQVPICGGAVKTPMDTLQDQVQCYTPNIFRRRSSLERDAACANIEQEESPIQPEKARFRSPHTEVTRTSTALLADEKGEQLRMAIEESMQMEQDRKHLEEMYHMRLRETKHIPVVLF